MDSKLPSKSGSKLLKLIEKNNLQKKAKNLIKSSLKHSREEIVRKNVSTQVTTTSRPSGKKDLNLLIGAKLTPEIQSEDSSRNSSFSSVTKHKPSSSSQRKLRNKEEIDQSVNRPKERKLKNEAASTTDQSKPSTSALIRRDDSMYPEIQLSPTLLPLLTDHRPHHLNTSLNPSNRNSRLPERRRHSRRRTPTPTPPPLFDDRGLYTGSLAQSSRNRYQLPAVELAEETQTLGMVRFTYRAALTETRNENNEQQLVHLNERGRWVRRNREERPR